MFFDPGFTANSAPFAGLEWPLGQALLGSKLAQRFRKIMTRALENLNGNQEKLGVPRIGLEVTLGMAFMNLAS